MNDTLASKLFERCAVLVALACALILPGCDNSNTASDKSNHPQTTQKDEQRVISGKVMYRERVALPENVTVTVILADVSRADAPMKVLAEEHIDNPGQIPIPFSLRYRTAAVTQSHPLAYAIRGEIRDADGILLWTTTERHPVDLSSEVAPDEITLMLQRVASARTPAMSSAMQDARDAGASFWAMGNEPGWHAVIYPDERIDFVGDYGSNEVTLPYVHPAIEGTESRYQTGDEEHQMTLSISEQGCQDTMSDTPFEYTVRVTLNEHEYRGCGRNL